MWIKCSERLPDINKRVIVCAETDDDPKYVCEMYLAKGNKWMYQEEWTVSHAFYIEAQYWQPLPEPPTD